MNDKAQKKLAVLLACHNRVNVTLRGLRSLNEALSGFEDWTFDTFLVDDGSVDGTTERVMEEFPEATVIAGSGDLYWTGGMRLAYEAATQSDQFDAFLLFNDDVEVNSSLRKFFDEYTRRNDVAPCILVGATQDRAREVITYSGVRVTSRIRMTFERVQPVAGGAECDTFNANFVLVPASVMSRTGGLDGHFTHGYADFDLGLTARKFGVSIRLHEEPVGCCDRGVGFIDRVRKLPRRERVVPLFGRISGPIPHLYFLWKHKPRWMMPLYACRTFLSHAYELVR